jgi:hypothetical protein
MIGVVAALLVVGIVMLFILPWVGIPVAAVAVILGIVYLMGWGRRTSATTRT